mmetsp:Transcript_3613/g.8479  ORF Transcript_3613/g.8479 Transcript_3613/m.8479 type:complete len:436 (-) Transcript_3613:554-1861(-)
MASALMHARKSPTATAYVCLFFFGVFFSSSSRPIKKVAKGFASLMALIHQRGPGGGAASVVSPRGFKKLMGDLCPQFQGYEQHDSQELLNFLIDGLHEDVNRVKVKQLTTPPEGLGRPDSEVAAEAWATYKKRNDSLLVDLCGGLFKSTVACPDCGRVSKTFDPYFTVSLPLAKEGRPSEFALQVHVQPIGSRRRRPFAVAVPRAGPVAALRCAAAELSGIPARELVVVEIHNGNFFKFFSDLDVCSEILKTDEIVCFQVEDRAPFADPAPSERFLKDLDDLKDDEAEEDEEEAAAAAPWPPPRTWPRPETACGPLSPGSNSGGGGGGGGRRIGGSCFPTLGRSSSRASRSAQPATRHFSWAPLPPLGAHCPGLFDGGGLSSLSLSSQRSRQEWTMASCLASLNVVAFLSGPSPNSLMSLSANPWNVKHFTLSMP